jgi:hypothetical protein
VAVHVASGRFKIANASVRGDYQSVFLSISGELNENYTTVKVVIFVIFILITCQELHVESLIFAG